MIHKIKRMVLIGLALFVLAASNPPNHVDPAINYICPSGSSGGNSGSA